MYCYLSFFFFQIRACSQRLLTQWKMSYDVTVNHWSNRMNSLTVTRPLPLHSQWKCLSAAITGGNSSSQSLSPVNIQPLRLGQKSCKQVLVFSENCRPLGCTFVLSQHFHTAGIQCICEVMAQWTVKPDLLTWWWWWLFPRLREFGENVWPFILRLHFFFSKWRLDRAH